MTPVKITNNYIVTSLDQGIYFAIRVARLFIEKSMESKQKEIPIDKIQKETEKVIERLCDFKNVHSKLTQIDNASDYIRRNIDKLKKDIEEGLASINELLSV